MMHYRLPFALPIGSRSCAHDIPQFAAYGPDLQTTPYTSGEVNR